MVIQEMKIEKEKTIKKRYCNRTCSSQQSDQFFEPEGVGRNRVLQLWYEC